nr:hypothetical protein BHI3_35510 [Bacteriovorax sp. HI3]
MSTHYKKNVLPLFFFSVLIYVGVYFSDFSGSFGASNWYVLVTHLLLTLNACLLGFVVKSFSGEERLAFLLGLIYLILPLNLEIFYFPSQIQFLVADTFVLLGLLAFIKKKMSLSTGLVLLAAALNVKGALFLILLLVRKETSFSQRVYLTGALLIILMFSINTMIEPSYSLQDNYYRFAFTLENSVFPVNLSLFNLGVLYPGYYSSNIHWYIGSLACAGLLYFVYKKSISSLIFFVLFAGAALPVKYISFPFGESYFFYPRVNGAIIWGLIFLLFSLMMKFKNAKYANHILTCFVVLLGVANLSFQYSFLNFNQSWEKAMNELPENINYEFLVKTDYAQSLINAREFNKARVVLENIKEKFRVMKIYDLLLAVYVNQNDPAGIDTLRREIMYYKINEQSASPETK